MASGNNLPVKNAPLKYIARITPALIFILLAFAVYFYKERMLYIDAPHVLFRIINEGHFWIEECRYGSFISQVLPLIGLKLHLPLRWLMILYSADFYVFYLIVSLLLVYTYRNYGLAILLGLYFTLFVSDTFYWANNEVHQGIGWLLIVFAVNFDFAAKNKHTLIILLLFIASFFIALWTHPLVMLAAIYLWFFYMADKALWPYSKMQSVLFSVILVLLSFLKIYQGMHHGYDDTKLEMVTHVQSGRIKTILHSPQLHFFLQSCVHQYRFFSLLFIAGLIGTLRAKNYIVFIWTLLFVSGYLMLTSITFWDTNSRSYMESEYMPLVIICCAPFVYYVLPEINLRFGIALFILIYIVRLNCIYNAAVPFTGRVAIMENINEKMKAKHLTKMIIPEPVAVIDSGLIITWAAPVESIFISKLKGENPQRTFIFLNAGQVSANDTITNDTLLGAFERRGVSHINDYYFQFDTTTVYKLVSYSALVR